MNIQLLLNLIKTYREFEIRSIAYFESGMTNQSVLCANICKAIHQQMPSQYRYLLSRYGV